MNMNKQSIEIVKFTLSFLLQIQL